MYSKPIQYLFQTIVSRSKSQLPLNPCPSPDATSVRPVRTVVPDSHVEQRRHRRHQTPHRAAFRSSPYGRFQDTNFCPSHNSRLLVYHLQTSSQLKLKFNQEESCRQLTRQACLEKKKKASTCLSCRPGFRVLVLKSSLPENEFGNNSPDTGCSVMSVNGFSAPARSRARPACRITSLFLPDWPAVWLVILILCQTDSTHCLPARRIETSMLKIDKAVIQGTGGAVVGDAGIWEADARTNHCALWAGADCSNPGDGRRERLTCQRSSNRFRRGSVEFTR